MSKKNVKTKMSLAEFLRTPSPVPQRLRPSETRVVEGQPAPPGPSVDEEEHHVWLTGEALNENTKEVIARILYDCGLLR